METEIGRALERFKISLKNDFVNKKLLVEADYEAGWFSYWSELNTFFRKNYPTDSKKDFTPNTCRRIQKDFRYPSMHEVVYDKRAPFHFLQDAVVIKMTDGKEPEVIRMEKGKKKYFFPRKVKELAASTNKMANSLYFHDGEKEENITIPDKEHVQKFFNTLIRLSELLELSPHNIGCIERSRDAIRKAYDGLENSKENNVQNIASAYLHPSVPENVVLPTPQTIAETSEVKAWFSQTIRYRNLKPLEKSGGFGALFEAEIEIDRDRDRDGLPEKLLIKVADWRSPEDKNAPKNSREYNFDGGRFGDFQSRMVLEARTMNLLGEYADPNDLHVAMSYGSGFILPFNDYFYLPCIFLEKYDYDLEELFRESEDARGYFLDSEYGPRRVVFELLAPLLFAVAHAHCLDEVAQDKGKKHFNDKLIHRDVKPSNCLIEKAPENSRSNPKLGIPEGYKPEWLLRLGDFGSAGAYDLRNSQNFSSAWDAVPTKILSSAYCTTAEYDMRRPKLDIMMAARGIGDVLHTASHKECNNNCKGSWWHWWSYQTSEGGFEKPSWRDNPSPLPIFSTEEFPAQNLSEAQKRLELILNVLAFGEDIIGNIYYHLPTFNTIGNHKIPRAEDAIVWAIDIIQDEEFDVEREWKAYFSGNLPSYKDVGSKIAKIAEQIPGGNAELKKFVDNNDPDGLDEWLRDNATTEQYNSVQKLVL